VCLPLESVLPILGLFFLILLGKIGGFHLSKFYRSVKNGLYAAIITSVIFRIFLFSIGACDQTKKSASEGIEVLFFMVYSLVLSGIAFITIAVISFMIIKITAARKRRLRLQRARELTLLQHAKKLSER